MHVLMTTDAVGGVWGYCLELIRGLEALDVRVTLACLGPSPRPEQRAAIDGLDNCDLVAREGRLEWMSGCEDDLDAAGAWLLELEQRLQPNLVHLNEYAHAARDWRAPALVVGHSCVRSWWRSVNREEAPSSWEGYRRRVRAGLRAARAVVAPTAWMLAQLLTYGVRFRGLVINNARRAGEFIPGPNNAVILGAGRLWDEGKNLATLDAAAARLPWPVLVAGEVHHPDGHVVTTRHIELLGALPPNALAWWMSHAAIFAHPARYEPFGLAPLEAALSGCALVLGDIASLREVWGDAALFVDPNDHAALARTLRALINDPVRRNSMAARAQVRAKRYSVARMVAAYHELYVELVRDRMVTACAS